MVNILNVILLGNIFEGQNITLRFETNVEQSKRNVICVSHALTVQVPRKLAYSFTAEGIPGC